MSKRKVYTFYLKVKYFEFERPCPKSVFQGQDDELIGLYKDLPTETINGETVITAKAIRLASCPEDMKEYLNENGTFISPFDGREYRSYGEWLITMGTEGCDDETIHNGCRGVVFGTMPISDGIQKFKRMNSDGSPMKRQKSGQLVIQQKTDVCTEVVYFNNEWISKYGDAEEALKHEVAEQVSRGLWRLIDENLPTLQAKEKQEEKEKFEVFPIIIDHIRVQDCEYNRFRNRATTAVETDDNYDTGSYCDSNDYMRDAWDAMTDGMYGDMPEGFDGDFEFLGY